MNPTTIPAEDVFPDTKGAAAPAYRKGSKKARLVDLLQSPEGASVAHLAATLGWQPHTTRAALTSLRKDGHDLVKLPPPDGERASRYQLKLGARR